MNITTETKNTVALTQDQKGPSPDFNEEDFAFQDAQGKWQTPGIQITTETKTTISLSNDNKNI